MGARPVGSFHDTNPEKRRLKKKTPNGETAKKERLQALVSTLTTGSLRANEDRAWKGQAEGRHEGAFVFQSHKSFSASPDFYR